MAHAEKELEDKLVEVGSRLASPPSDVEELLSLLDQAESFLSRVDQLPSQSMSSALYPAMKALVAKELLDHSELDVKVYVASCISEITRITAPDAPYNDNLMKDIFKVIVGVFENLNDLSTRSHSKRVSILETVASVQFCVVMLDLECDDLILEMFQYFLKTIRPIHSGNIFSSMATIMTLILKESEDISSELLSCLLVSVKKKNTDVLPIARRLGEKVMGSSAAMLKPYLVNFFQSMGASLSDYSNIVASICQENSDTQDLNDQNSSDECLVRRPLLTPLMADDRKLTGRTISDELPQVSANLRPEVGCPGKIGTIAVKSPMLVLGNGTLSIENGDSILGNSYPKQKPERYCDRDQSKSAIAAEPDELDSSTAVKPDSMADHIAKKRMGRKSSSNSDRAALTVASRRRGRSKEADVLQYDGPSFKGAEASLCLQPEGKAEHETSADLGRTVCISSPTPSENIPDVTQPQKSQLFGLKVTAKKGGVNAAVDQPASTFGQKSYLSEEETLHSKDNASKKEDTFNRDSVGKILSRSGKMVLKENARDGATPSADVPSKKEVDGTIDSEAKNLRKGNIKRSARSITERKLSGKLQKYKTNQQKERAIVVKVEAEDLSLKEMISSWRSLKALNRGQYHLESNRTQSKRKRVTGTVEFSEAQNPEKDLNEYLVGSKIKVWWPDDKRFYDGMVHSFDPVSKKHKILYFDGDVEVLLLKNERWELIEDGGKTDRGQAKDTPIPDNSTEMPSTKKTKKSSDFIMKKERTEPTLRSGGRPASQSRAHDTRSSGKADLSKTRGRPEARYSQTVSSSIDETSDALRRSTEKVARKYGDRTVETSSFCTGEPGDNSEDDEIIKLGHRFKNFIHKISSESKDEALKPGGRTRPKDEAPKMFSKSDDGAINTADKSGSCLAKTAIKSEERTPKTGRKLRGTGGSGRGGESDPNTTSSKGNPKKQESNESAAKGAIRSSRVTRRRVGFAPESVC